MSANLRYNKTLLTVRFHIHHILMTVLNPTWEKRRRISQNFRVEMSVSNLSLFVVTIIMFKDVQSHLTRRRMKICGNKLGTDRVKRKRLSIDVQLLSRFTCTQTRARTGMGCPTGVWDQRVYRFRHLGIGVLRVQRYAFYFVPQNFWSKSFAETVSLRAFLLFYF